MIFSRKLKFQLQKCHADKSRPECSLIEELREIQKKQKELGQTEYLHERRRVIMDLLYKTTNVYTTFSSYLEYSGILYDIECKGCNYTSIEGLNKAISLLQEYKELTEKQLECEQRAKDLKKRQKDIKNMLGIN